MTRISPLAAAIAALLLLAGCGTSPELSVDDEAYRGQLAAAVTPVRLAGAARVSGYERDRIQARIVTGLDSADIFASAIPLSAPGQANEAEVIIDPSVIDASPGGRGLERLTLQVVTRGKSTGRIGLNQRYTARGSGGRDALDKVIGDLTKDLRRTYGERPVY